MKKILFVLLIASNFIARAQVYNNEWIDYTKTYYKFKIAKDGICRVSQSVLNGAGLGAVPAEQFQLWRNGVQVPLHTSVATGPLPANGFIEFWGKMNDGKADKQLYRNPSFQLNDKWNLLTDTATYFLTANPVVTENLRLENAVNDVAANTLPVEPYFMYTMGKYFKDRLNSGKAVYVGSNLYSSSYDDGEGWSSSDIVTTSVDSVTVNYGSHTSSLTNLFVYNGGPAPSFKIAVSGNGIYERRYKVTINGDSVLSNQFIEFKHSIDSANLAASTISSNTATVVVKNLSFVGCYPLPTGCQTDRMTIHQYELTYPRLFNFGGASSFEFSLPESAAGNYIEISNFNSGTSAPVLYDLSNGKRYTADMGASPLLRFALPPSAIPRSLVLMNVDLVTMIGSLETRNFINYSDPSNVGDYLIITNPLLFNGSGGNNPVEDYRAYRSSAAGGGYNAKIYLADELVDQFGFGIKKNPLAIRNFLLFARRTYAVEPKYIFIIGKGIVYSTQYSIENGSNLTDKQYLARQNLVPAFGVPASDALLVAEPGSSLPQVPIGRLSVVNPDEITVYLNKVKDYEQVQATGSPNSADKAWMKNVVHIVGASDENLGDILAISMQKFKGIITDTSYGAKVSTFSKNSADEVEKLTNVDLTNLINSGSSLITYFGHSSTSTLQFNLDNPENYNNQGKYPIFIGLGCNAGNFFTYSPTRFYEKVTISEKYVLAPNRGTIGFIASTHFGIVHYLDIWNEHAYKQMTGPSYGKSIGEIMRRTAQDVFAKQSEFDFYARANIEQTELHGDPSLRLNQQSKPDFVIEEPMVKLSPVFVSVADASFKIDAKFLNVGKASNTSFVVEVRRQYPDQTTSVISRDTVQKLTFADSISIVVPIDPAHDKGLNKIIITIDPENQIDELYKSNNSIIKDVMIYEDEARPVYPYNFAIINKPTVELVASTANPFSPTKQYRMEMDTTELFNSPFKIVQTVTQPGGVMKFNTGVNLKDSTVYYWRVAPVPDSGPFSWNTASFVYLPNSDLGFNQSHLYQHFKSSIQNLTLDSSSRNWSFNTTSQNLFIRVGSWATSTPQEDGVSISVNTDPYIHNSCFYQCLTFSVFDEHSFKPWKNITSINNSPVGGLYGSGSSNCYSGRLYNFEYRWDSVSNRKRAMDFMQNVIPDGAYVVVRSFLLDPVAFPSYASMLKYADDWKADTAVHGSGQSLYHYLKNTGFNEIDSFNRPRQFALVYKKNDPSFTPRWVFSQGTIDNPTLNVDCPTLDTIGFVISPKFGPAKKWKTMKWVGNSIDPGNGDFPTLNLLGYKPDGQMDTLYQNVQPGQQGLDLTAVDAKQYPYLQLEMSNIDSVYYTPYQINYWRLTYDPVPEGAVAPNEYFIMKDTVDVAEPVKFQIAFRNVSETSFADSVRINMAITDRNNVTHVLPSWKQRNLPVNDTLHVEATVDTRQLVGSNTMYVEVNPVNEQPEQYHFNNSFYKNFYVRPDTLNPLMDVTFDNVHILNHDIVSARPSISIKLKDESKWFLLSDTATVTVQVRFPDGQLVDYHFDGSTMQYVPAQQAPTNDNSASVLLKPYFDQDGDYELIVSGKDMSDNKAGAIQYRVAFQVFNKPMISNMLNYPNPFTTSTAFVFTITGSEVPQNIRIQILTITGKVVREITKDELGTLRVGRNITEFKWDGTDQYGQKLANGVYLYRVITNLNGKSLDKFKSESDNTDKYFNKGYGKMYLMR